MAPSSLQAFLPSTPVRLTPATPGPSSAHICFRHRYLLYASASQNGSSSDISTLRSWANVAIIAATSSMLALSIPSLFNTNMTAIPQAHAARGGGASFTSASGEVIKDPEALLRWSLPISNDTVRSLQKELESAVNELRGLKWSKVENHIRKASLVLKNQTNKILTDVPSDSSSKASDLLNHVAENISTVESAVTERNGDKVTSMVRTLLRDVGTVEQMMVTEFPYKVPPEYGNLPRLLGRATVEMTVRKAGDEQFDINGTFVKEGKLILVLDGYSAPISAGNFVDLVDKGFYNNIDVLRSDGFIVQAGKPRKGDGYVDDNGQLRTIPLEVFPKSDKEPMYGITLEEDGRGAESTVLPFTSYGTLAVARKEFEPNSASSQFFWFLFEPDLTPAGRNLMDGNWAVMGYTTNGGSFLRELQKGDLIVSAKVIDGMQNLVRVSGSKGSA